MMYFLHSSSAFSRRILACLMSSRAYWKFIVLWMCCWANELKKEDSVK